MKSSYDTAGHGPAKRTSSGQSRQLTRTSSSNQNSASLLDAVRLGKVDAVLSLLSSGADANCSDYDGRSALQVCVENGGNITILKELLKVGASPNKSNPNTNQTVLHIAARKGYQVCVRALIQAGADIDRRDANGNTPLVLAIQAGHSLIVQELLEEACDVNLFNAHHETPLHVAVKNGFGDVVEELIKYGADANLADFRNQTPFYLACKGQLVDIASFLIRQGDCDVNGQDTQTGRAPLHWAAEHGNKELVRQLVSRGANPNIGDKDWSSPFLMALDKGHKDIVLYLLSTNKCDVSVTNKFCNTALHIAARDGHVDLLDAFVRLRQDVNVKGPCGTTPLMIAAFEGRVDVVNRLFEHGAKVTLTDRFRSTALIHAIISPESDDSTNRIVCRLIRANVDVDQGANVQSLLGTIDTSRWKITTHLEARMYSPLEVAMLTGRTTVIMMLMKRGCALTPAFKKTMEYRYLTASTENVKTLQDFRTILREVKSARSLKELCRNSIFDHLKGREPSIVLKGCPVERKLLQYLRFPDLEQMILKLRPVSLPDQSNVVEKSTEPKSNGVHQTTPFVRNSFVRRTHHMGQKHSDSNGAGTANGHTRLSPTKSGNSSALKSPTSKTDASLQRQHLNSSSASPSSADNSASRPNSTQVSNKISPSNGIASAKRPQDFGGSNSIPATRQYQQSHSSNNTHGTSPGVNTNGRTRTPSDSHAPKLRLKTYETFDSNLDVRTMSTDTSPTGSTSSGMNKTGSRNHVNRTSAKSVTSPKSPGGSVTASSPTKPNKVPNHLVSPGVENARNQGQSKFAFPESSSEHTPKTSLRIYVTNPYDQPSDIYQSGVSPMSPGNLLSPPLSNGLLSPSTPLSLLSSLSPSSPLSPTNSILSPTDRPTTPRSRLPQPVWRHQQQEDSFKSPSTLNGFNHVTHVVSSDADNYSKFKRTYSLRK